ncbi:hypothetical protein [Kribbella ginsengisoli]|uniref:Lipoprotein n=1 Tax=Kribbella ginsengisoli TaxID=363865 RepID=A0ABP6Z6N4_9ACTN
MVIQQMFRIVAPAGLICLIVASLVGCDSSSGSPQSNAGPSAYCAKLTEFNGKSAKPGDFSTLLASAEEVQKVAPDGQREKWDLLVSYARRLSEAANDQRKLTAVLADESKARAANDAVASYAKEHCGLQMRSN